MNKGIDSCVHCKFLRGHWGLIVRGGAVLSALFLLKVFTALKGTQFMFLFVVTASGVVPCGGPKK